MYLWLCTLLLCMAGKKGNMEMKFGGNVDGNWREILSFLYINTHNKLLENWPALQGITIFFQPWLLCFKNI